VAKQPLPHLVQEVVEQMKKAIINV